MSEKYVFKNKKSIDNVCFMTEPGLIGNLDFDPTIPLSPSDSFIMLEDQKKHRLPNRQVVNCVKLKRISDGVEGYMFYLHFKTNYQKS